MKELIRRRYETGSLVITSNRALPEWAPMLGDALPASSAIDRLLHHCHVVTLDGHSYRKSAVNRSPPDGADPITLANQTPEENDTNSSRTSARTTRSLWPN